MAHEPKDPGYELGDRIFSVTWVELDSGEHPSFKEHQVVGIGDIYYTLRAVLKDDSRLSDYKQREHRRYMSKFARTKKELIDRRLAELEHSFEKAKRDVKRFEEQLKEFKSKDFSKYL